MKKIHICKSITFKSILIISYIPLYSLFNFCYIKANKVILQVTTNVR